MNEVPKVAKYAHNKYKWQMLVGSNAFILQCDWLHLSMIQSVLQNCNCNDHMQTELDFQGQLSLLSLRVGKGVVHIVAINQNTLSRRADNTTIRIDSSGSFR